MLSGETSQTTVSKTCIKSAGFLREPVRDQIELRAVSPIDFKKGVEASAAIEASNVRIGI